MENPKPPFKKPLDPRIRRLLISAGLGLAFGFGCRALPDEYQVICSVFGKLLAGAL